MANTIQKIPVDSILSNKEFRTELDGIFFLLSFRFNSRAAIWMMDISDENSNIIVSGIALLLGVNLLGRFPDSKLPPGTLFVENFSEENVEATRDNLGEDILLLYAKTT